MIIWWHLQTVHRCGAISGSEAKRVEEVIVCDIFWGKGADSDTFNRKRD